MRILIRKILILIATFIIAVLYFSIVNISNAEGNNADDYPEFYGTTSITIRLNDELNLKSSMYRILAKDRLDGNITKNIRVVSNNVNNKVVGEYEIKYEVSNSRGKKATITVPVNVVGSGARTIQRTLYVLPDLSYLDDNEFNRGNQQDRQNLGIYIPAGEKVYARQVNKNSEEDLYVHFYNDDCLTEGSNSSSVGRGLDILDTYDVSSLDTRIKIESDKSSYTELKNVTRVQRKLKDGEGNWEDWDEYNNKSYDSIPMVKTLFGVEEKPIIEIIITNKMRDLDYFTYGDNEQEFKSKWQTSNNAFGIIDGDRAQFIVPYKDLDYLGVSKKEQNSEYYKHDNFTKIEDILEYYDDVVETYDECIGLSYDAQEYYNKNVKTKFLIKANKHGAGNAQYKYWDYIHVYGDSIDCFLHNPGEGWIPLHEIGHGYQGYLKSNGDIYLAEISNNFLVNYYQKNKLNEDSFAKYSDEEYTTALQIVKQKNEPFLKNREREPLVNKLDTYYFRNYVYINLLNRIGTRSALLHTYRYCRELAYNGQKSEMTATDIIAKGFSDGTGYNVIPYLEDWKLNVSDSVKKEIYNKDYQIAWYLRDLVASDQKAQEIQNVFNLPWRYSLVPNFYVSSYNLTGNLKIMLNDTQFSQLENSKIVLKTAQGIIKEVTINSKAVYILDVPIGAYEVEIIDDKYILEPTYAVISENKTNTISVQTLVNFAGINIKTPPEKCEYIEGQDFNTDGMVVIANYNDGTTKEITDYIVIAGKKLTAGTKSISILYTENDITKKAVQGITVVAKTLTKIEITKEPTKKSYVEGQNFDIEGMEVKATYDNGSTEVITEYEVTNGTNLKVGQPSVTIKYGEKEATQGITVVAKELTKIEITKEPTNKSYIEGQNFDREGMEVKATYDNGRTEVIENYEITNGNNLSKDQTSVTIKYTENQVTKEAIQTIDVREKLSIEIEQLQNIQKEGKTYIKSISPSTTIKSLLEKINTNGTLEIYKGTQKVTNVNTKLGTGMKIKISLNNEQVEYTIVVTGDTSGDGEVGFRDILQVNKHRLKKVFLTGEYLEAGDVTGDGNVDFKDILKINKYRLGKISSL